MKRENDDVYLVDMIFMGLMFSIFVIFIGSLLVDYFSYTAVPYETRVQNAHNSLVDWAGSSDNVFDGENYTIAWKGNVFQMTDYTGHHRRYGQLDQVIVRMYFTDDSTYAVLADESIHKVTINDYLAYDPQ